MKWNYKRIIIRVNNEGLFYCLCNGVEVNEFTLQEVKKTIDTLTEKYYNFTEKDIQSMLKKLDNREKDFVNSLLQELSCHWDNAYCEIGITDNMLFNGWLEYGSSII
jgi:hypothetical protein